jgi:Na+/pantothenate symporter
VRTPMNALSTFDLFIFFGSLLAVMGVGLWAGRKEEDSADYFLAGRSARWWGVAGSIFGSNVSANHIVGMMGVGFSVGFAQSHFEISAIFGLLLLCYGFLPVYRKLNVYTLSEYLGRRYSDSSRMAYAVIMVIVIVVIQMVPGFYIGSRSLNILLQEEAGPIDPGHYKWGIVLMALVTGTYTIIGGLKAVIVTDVLQSILMLLGALVVGYLVFSQPEIGTIGMPEHQARETFSNLDIWRAKFRPMKHTLSGRDEKMLMKMIVDADTDRVVGLHVLGDSAGEMAQTLGVAIKMGATKADFDATMAVHPTATEELVTLGAPSERVRNGETVKEAAE